MDLAGLKRWDSLPGLRIARDLVRRALGVELLLVDAQGPLAHQIGGVMRTGANACDAALFVPEGFRQCDAFYRELGEQTKACRRECPMGLRAMALPIHVDDEVVAHIVASGYTSERSQLVIDRLERLGVAPPLEPAPVLDSNQRRVLAAALEACAAEIEAIEAARSARRASGHEQSGLIGESAQLMHLREELPRLAQSDATVLILGESGTGKELVARALHDLSKRQSSPFIAQNCGALTEDLLESALFGHVRGAFTGADRSHEGLFSAAGSGTLFLDEVGEMSPAVQAKLLRVLQDGSYKPLGSTSEKISNARVLAATHRDLHAMVETGAFRRDLYFRLNVLQVQTPPLRERAGDVRVLITHFLANSTAPANVDALAWRCLERYAWPGNVRELRAEIARWELRAAGERCITPAHLSPQIQRADGYLSVSPTTVAGAIKAETLAQAIEHLEREMISRGLADTDGNRTALAKRLGISRTTLGERMKRYDIDG